MSHKITAAGLAAEVSRTDFALPEVDWNEQPVKHPCAHHGHYGECLDLAVETPEQPRTGRANWGPREAVEYRPRWNADHHPWAVIGTRGNGVRYANIEVDED